MMEVIGAINLFNNQCIDTLESDHKVILDCNPVNLAIKWNNIGINWIHLVDVNGYKGENPVNISIIKDIISKVNVPIQVASGADNIVSFEDMLAAGAGRIVLENKILKDSEFIKLVLKEYPEKTIISFNVDSGITEINGDYHEDINDIIKELEKQGLKRIIYHDTSKNYEFNYNDLISIGQNTQLPIIAAGKLNSLESIKKLKQIADCNNINLEGIILSKPLYNNAIDLYELIKLIDAYPYIGDFYSREDIC